MSTYTERYAMLKANIEPRRRMRYVTLPYTSFREDIMARAESAARASQEWHARHDARMAENAERAARLAAPESASGSIVTHQA